MEKYSADMMKVAKRFHDYVRQWVYNILNKEKVLESEFHIATVTQILTPTSCMAIVDGLGSPQKLYNNPDIVLTSGNIVSVFYRQKNPLSKFITHRITGNGPQGVYNFSITHGDSRNIYTTITDINGNPLNLSGYSVNYSLINSSGGTVLTKSVGNGITILPSGQICIALSSTDTSSLSGSYTYPVQVINPSGAVSTVLTGVMTVN